MASSSSNTKPHAVNPFEHTSIPNTTFVQADPSTFRDVVQRLTGASPSGPAGKQSPSSEMASLGHAFKLQERRPTSRKLEIKLGGGGGSPAALHSAARTHWSFAGENSVVFSPVSPLECSAARYSPRSPVDEEERAIAEKGFYFHPNPQNNPRGSDPPELLTLFPLRSPREEC